MKLIKPSFEIIEQPVGELGVYKQIEGAGRICYKSEDRITEDSCLKFVEMLKSKQHCYTKDIEILTDVGWIKFNRYNGEKVAVINQDCSFKGFEIPERIIKHSYKGNFYYYPSMGLEVTDGHRMFGVFRESKNDFYNNSNYSTFKCGDYYKDNNGREKTLGQRMFKSPKHCTKPTMTDPYGELIGFWLGDGCYSSTTKNKLVFHLKKERKINYLKQLCDELGYIFEPREADYYTVTNNNIGSSFNSLFYNNGKRIPYNYFPSTLIGHSIIQGLINSDGSLGVNTKTITFTSTSYSIINWLLQYAPLCGYTISDRGIAHYSSSGNPVYKILLLDTNYTLNNDFRNKDSKVIITNKEEEVYCVTVSTGLILVRGTNGITTICGNCAMLEHGTVYLGVKDKDLADKYSTDKYSVVTWISYGMVSNTDVYYITTNLRVLVENGWLDDLKYLCEPTKHHEKRVTVKFICDIGITREFNRHRVNSRAEESTRYCNYTKDKFGGINVILPNWMNKEDFKIPSSEVMFFNYCDDLSSETQEFKSWEAIDYWLFANLSCEFSYNNLIRLGQSPQQARSVLPLGTKSELVHTAFVKDWKHFFDLRDSKYAHPQAFEIAHPLHEEFIRRGLINGNSTH